MKLTVVTLMALSLGLSAQDRFSLIRPNRSST